MMVTTSEPDPPHSHPHEQVTYVVEGELIFYLDGEPHQLEKGDMFTVPPDIPHTVQLLTQHVRLLDSFTHLEKIFYKPNSACISSHQGSVSQKRYGSHFLLNPFF